jgi:hypothetical protein
LSGWLAAGLSTAGYMIGAGRTFSFDSAITFANFVATPSLREVLGGRTAIEHSGRSLTGTNPHPAVTAQPRHLDGDRVPFSAPLCRKMWPTINSAELAASSRTRLSASSTVAVMGFSTRQWMPLARAWEAAV